MPIPEEVEHGIRRKWNIDSRKWNTREVERRIRRKWNIGSWDRERSSVA